MSYYPKPRILMGDEMTHLRDAHRSIAKVIWHEFHLTSPFYTKFLSLILLLSPNTLVIIQIIQTLILFCVAFLVYHLGYLIFKKKEVGLMAAVLLISYPPIIAFAHFFWSDILHLFFFLLSFYLLIRFNNHILFLSISGFSLGLALIIKSGFLLPFIPVFIFYLVVKNRGKNKFFLLLTYIVSLSMAMLSAKSSFSMKNSHLMGTNNFYFNLWVGLNDLKDREQSGEIAGLELNNYNESSEKTDAKDAILKMKIKDFLKQRSIIAILKNQLGKQYFRLLSKNTFFTDALPGGFFAKQGMGYYEPSPIIYIPYKILSYLLYLFVLFSSVFAFIYFKNNSLESKIIILFLFYNLIIFLFLHVKTRYRIQFLPFLFLYSAYFISSVYEKIANKAFLDFFVSRAQKCRGAVALVISLFALYLAI